MILPYLTNRDYLWNYDPLTLPPHTPHSASLARLARQLFRPLQALRKPHANPLWPIPPAVNLSRSSLLTFLYVFVYLADVSFFPLPTVVVVVVAVA